MGSSIGDVLRTTGEFLKALPSLVKKPPAWDSVNSIGLRVQDQAAARPDASCIVFEGRYVSWGEFDRLSNQVANALAARGIGRGDCVALLMENRVEQLAALVGITKLGAIAGLLNTNLRGTPLAHCVRSTEGRALLVGAELADAADGVREELGFERDALLWWADSREPNAACPGWATDVGALVADAGDGARPELGDIRYSDPAMYIFTSGTTGLPKAAVMGHGRYLNGATSMCRLGLRARSADRIYICLPLYHGTGLIIGVGSALVSGASMVIRRKFSASNFLPEVREHGCTAFIYIGELCRYLLSQDVRDDDADNPLVKICGNGLRPDIWMEFKQRYGIKRIAEFYGASEGPAGFLNVLNKDRTIGLTPMNVKLVQYDVDAEDIVRDGNGRAIEVPAGEPGLMVAEISETARFEGYTNKEATEKKIRRDLFSDGDAWFDSGDLMREVDVGFNVGQPHYQFVDRLGDTFRWKGENCSTNEVGELVNEHPDVHMTNVYGVEVPGTDGKAGMAALIAEPGREVDMASLSAHVVGLLPAYARPVFVRLLPEMEVTGTFKLVKGDLRKEAWDPDTCPDPVWVMKPGSTAYEPLDADFVSALREGKAGY